MRNLGVRTSYLAGLIVFFWACLSQATAQLTYHGRLLDPSNQPVTASSVQFQVQIRSPGAEDCLLYQEVQTKNLSSTNGFFSINLGDGSGTVTLVNSYSLSRVFQNRASFSSLIGCAVGSSYTPSAGEGRRIALRFNDGTGWEDLQTKPLAAVPQAMESMTVGGFSAENLLRVENAGVPQSVTPLTSTQLANLISVADTGNITGNAPTATTATNATNFTGSLAGDVTGTQGATIVARLQGRNVSTTAPANGEVLKWNGTAWAPAVDGGGGGSVTSVSASAPLVSSGGTTPDLSLTNGSASGQTLRWGGASWSTAKLNYQDLVNNVAASPWPGASCTSGQFLTWSSVSDSFSCTAVSGAMVNTALGYTPLNPANNLSDVANVATARTNLGAGDFFANGSVSMTGNIRLNGNYLSGDGGNEGVFVDSVGQVGVGTMTPQGKLEIKSGADFNAITLGTDVLTGADNGAMIAGKRKNQAQEPFAALATWDWGTSRKVYLGGGNWDMPSATEVSIYVQPNYDETTNTFEERFNVTADGYANFFGPWTSFNRWGNDDFGHWQEFYKARGTRSAPAPVQSGDDLGNIWAGGYNGTNWGTGGGARIGFEATENQTATNGGTSIFFQTTPNASQTRATRMVIGENGYVGIGTSSPRGSLDVNGVILGKAPTAAGSSTFDFSTGNLLFTNSNCGAFNLHHLKSGANYVLGVKGTTSTTCSFNAYSDAGVTGLTLHLPPDHGATTAGLHTIYSFLVLGSDVYVSWIPGY